MRRVLKWGLYGLGGLAAVALTAAGAAFAASEVMLRIPQARPLVRIAAATDPAAAERGRRIAIINGCVDCHGANLQGRLFDDLPGIAKLYAPNLTRVTARASDADLDLAIRHGIGRDGRALYIMPSSALAHLTDAEEADLLAYLRTLPPAGAEQPGVQVGPIGRIGVLLGKFRSEPLVIAAHENPRLPDLGPEHRLGREVARACVECHGPQLQGGGPAQAPDLMIAASYDPADLERLLRTGKAAGDRELRLMSASSRIRFAALTDAEIVALHGYLKARAERVANGVATKALPKP